MRHDSGGGEGEVTRIALVAAGESPLIIPDLEPTQTYSVQIAHVNGLGAGPYSAASNAVTTAEDNKENNPRGNNSAAGEAPGRDKTGHNNHGLLVCIVYSLTVHPRVCGCLKRLDWLFVRVPAVDCGESPVTAAEPARAGQAAQAGTT
jgi:hypothetical protein